MNANLPLVSIIVPVYQAELFLKNILEKILENVVDLIFLMRYRLHDIYFV